MSKIELPKKFSKFLWEKTGKKEEYKQHIGKPMLSYSQYTAYKDPEYRPEYILKYFMGVNIPTNIFAQYGGEVGGWLEFLGAGVEEPTTTYLSDNDKQILASLDFPPNCTYEEPILLDLNEFVVFGYIDRCEYNGNTVCVTDFKTGNIDKKVAYYSSEEYGQTTLYSHKKKQDGYEVECSKVLLLGRKGHGRSENHPIRLSNENVEISTPYSEERAEKLIKDIKKVAKEIAEHYKVYKKLAKL